MKLLLVVYYGWYSEPVIRISNEIKHLENEILNEILKILEKGSAEEHFYKILELLRQYYPQVRGEGGFLPDNSFAIEFYLE